MGRSSTITGKNRGLVPACLLAVLAMLGACRPLTADTVDSAHLVPNPGADAVIASADIRITPAARIDDLAYGPVETQRLDLLLPAGPGPHPVIIYLHGGGWSGGTRTDLSPDAAAMVDRGWAVATVDYALAPAQTWPYPLYDAKRAVRWLRANANRFGLDPDMVIAWGSSAGGHLALMLGATGDEPRFTPYALPGDLAERSDRVQGVVALAAPVDFQLFADTDTPFYGAVAEALGCATAPRSQRCANRADYEPADLTRVVTGSAAPVYAAYGLADTLVVPEHAHRLERAYSQAGRGDALWLDLVDNHDHNVAVAGLNVRAEAAFVAAVRSGQIR